MRQAMGAPRRTLLIIGASMVFLASACSTSGGAKTASTTAPASTTSSTEPTTTSTEAPPTNKTPPETTAPATTTTTAPGASGAEPEDVAVGFLREAATGGDPSTYVNDPAVATEATLEWADVADGDRSSFTVEMETTYVDPEAQAGGAGECQLVGDITLQCAVLVTPPISKSGGGSPTLYAVYVSNLDPDSSLDDPRDVDYFVIDFEPIAG